MGKTKDLDGHSETTARVLAMILHLIKKSYTG